MRVSTLFAMASSIFVGSFIVGVIYDNNRPLRTLTCMDAQQTITEPVLDIRRGKFRSGAWLVTVQEGMSVSYTPKPGEQCWLRPSQAEIGK